MIKNGSKEGFASREFQLRIRFGFAMVSEDGPEEMAADLLSSGQSSDAPAFRRFFSVPILTKEP